MKILIDASISSKGGGVQVALSLIKNISQDPQFEIVCVTSPQVDAQLSDEVKSKIGYYYAEKNESIFGKRRQGKRIALIEEKHRPDLVFVVFGPSYWRPRAKTLQGFALPLMIYPETRNKVYRSNIILYFYQKVLYAYKANLMKKNSDFVVVETNAFKDRVHDFLKIDNNYIFVVENSFNSNFLENSQRTSDTLSGSLKNIFVPTAYYPHKNLEILVDVAVELKKKNRNDFRFNFLLDPSSDQWLNILNSAELNSVTQFFNSYGVVKNTQMKQLYKNNDLVILPTLAEASTAVYPESFISEKVLLTSNIDFAVELCGDAAIFFDPNDAVDIANKILGIADDIEKKEDYISKGLSQLKSSYLTPEEKWLKQKQLFLNLMEVSK